MSKVAMQIYSEHLFDTPDALDAATLDPRIRARLLRLREMYAWFIENPGVRDRNIVLEFKGRWRANNISERVIYEDLAFVKQLVPNLTPVTKDWARWKYNEMIQETYEMAKKRKDVKTMERCASSYAKYNRIDDNDVPLISYDEIHVQPFTATSDPTVLGIEPIPNLRSFVNDLIAKYSKDCVDIEDVKAEDVDLEEDVYYRPFLEAEKEQDDDSTEEADIL